jgi:two-component system, LytTR family, response regulator LytT
MKVVIIEDELPGAERLAGLLHSIDPTIEIQAIIDSVTDSVEWLRQHDHPDLIFMDIELSDGQCFRLFRETAVLSGIIFTTSYNEYATKAFEFNSIGYLTKPIGKEQLANSLKKYDAMKNLFRVDIAVVGEILQSYIPKPAVIRDRFLVKRGQKYLSIHIDEIAYFFSDERIVFLVTNEKARYILDYNLDELEEMLDSRYFFRANRAFIIHVKSVSGFENDFNSKLRLSVLPLPDREVLVSKEKATLFKAWMGK